MKVESRAELGPLDSAGNSEPEHDLRAVAVEPGADAGVLDEGWQVNFKAKPTPCNPQDAGVRCITPPYNRKRISDEIVRICR